LKESTIYSKAISASTFLASLQKEGIYNLKMISEKAVLNVFAGLDGNLPKGVAYKRNVEIVFKTCASIFPTGVYEKVIAFLPPLRNSRKNIQYLTEEEVMSVKIALTTPNNNLSLRDKAIGLLALHTGMRCGDIAGLTIDSIDWERDRICIRQQKTANPLQLELTAVIGNAIYDYLASERPKVDIPEIFITVSRPFNRFKKGSVSRIAGGIMKVAKIRENSGDRKGFHIFRHRLATKLLSNGISNPVISGVLGHFSPRSLDTYLSADFKRLKECAISVEKFSLRKRLWEVWK